MRSGVGTQPTSLPGWPTFGASPAASAAASSNATPVTFPPVSTDQRDIDLKYEYRKTQQECFRELSCPVPFTATPPMPRPIADHRQRRRKEPWHKPPVRIVSNSNLAKGIDNRSKKRHPGHHRQKPHNTR